MRNPMTLEVVTSTLQPCEELLREVEMKNILMPMIPDDFEHWQDLENDLQIMKSINNLEEFMKYDIDWREEEKVILEGI
jgi:hypothetical protein